MQGRGTERSVAVAEVEKLIRERIERDPYARLLGVKLLELGRGFARVQMEVREEMMNFHGVTHGGAVFSLADVAFAAASNSHGQVALALNMNINFLAATTTGATLTATATEEKPGNRTALYRIEVRDEREGLVAVLEGLVYRKKEPLLSPP